MQAGAISRRRVSKIPPHRADDTASGYQMTREDIDRFLETRKQKGLADDTLDRYRYALERLYQALPEGKRIQAGTLAQWREELIDAGRMPSGINVIFAACDGFMDFVGHREFQVGDRLTAEDKLQPELTRSEYLHLLQTAKLLGKERVYMMVKVFGTMGLRIQEMKDLTVEAVTEGRLTVSLGSGKQIVRVPECLRRELLGYVKRNGIRSGPVFVTRRGLPVNRSGIAVDIQRLGELAQIPEGKATPRALRKLCRQTRSNIESNMELLIDQALDRQLEQEQLTVGWEA